MRLLLTLMLLSLLACGPRLDRTGAALTPEVRRFAPIQDTPYCEPNSRLAPWLDCIIRCLPATQVRVICHKNQNMLPDYVALDGKEIPTTYAYVPSGKLCDGTPSYIVIQLERDDRTVEQLDGSSMGAWYADTQAECSLVDPPSINFNLYLEVISTKTPYYMGTWLTE